MQLSRHSLLSSGRRFALAGRKVVFKRREIDAPALEPNSLSLQQEPLLEPIFARQRDAAAGTQYSLPRQAWHLIQDLRDVTGTARIAGRLGDGAVGTDPSARNPADHCSNGNLRVEAWSGLCAS